MRALRRWWWFPLAALSCLLVKSFFLTPWVEGRVEAAVGSVLEAKGLDSVSYDGVDGLNGIGIDGLNVALSGPAALEQEAVAAVRASEAVDQVRYIPLDTEADLDDESAGADAGTDDTDAGTDDTEEPDDSLATEELQTEVAQSLNSLFELEPIEFSFAQATILPASTATLDKAADIINTHPEIGVLKVVGHTDSDGPDEANQILSEARASAVVNYLVTTAGVDPQRLLAEGRGETELLVDPETSLEDKQRNRRIAWEPTES